MKLLERLKERIRNFRRKGISPKPVKNARPGDRLLADQGDLVQNVDSLGGVATDGLNRFV